MYDLGRAAFAAVVEPSWTAAYHVGTRHSLRRGTTGELQGGVRDLPAPDRIAPRFRASVGVVEPLDANLASPQVIAAAVAARSHSYCRAGKPRIVGQDGRWREGRCDSGRTVS
jgi:hypothetical protein